MTISDPVALTPIERHGDFWFKRDDLFVVGEANGGKVRAMLRMLDGARGVVACGSRESTQIARAAQVAQVLGLPCRVHTAASSGADTSEIAAARTAGAEVVSHRPGYLTVVKARAREDAKKLGWKEIPWGLEAREAMPPTIAQVSELPVGARRLVVTVGSGMTFSALLHGLRQREISIPVLGVMVGGDPRERIARFAPRAWWKGAELVKAREPYAKEAPVTNVGELQLDPIYEAKTIPWLRPDDLLWIVGIRASARRRR